MSKRTFILPAFGLLACGLLLLAVHTGLADPNEPAPSLFAPTTSRPAETATQPAAPPAAKQPAAPHRSSSAATGKIKYVKRLEVKASPGSDLDDAYDNYFRKNLVDPKVVRAKVRRLLSEAKDNPRRHEEIVALLEAAIRNGQIQPWMYEALALSMEIAKRPAQDIERALMSAADFTTNPNEIMYLAQYLARLGHEARALQLFRQASALAPGRPEPYEHGLSLAERLHDLDAIQWSSLGILRQVWPPEKSALPQTARYSAEAAIEKLRQEGRAKEADAFAAALADATLRDIEVRVSWVGDAEVDLMVEEPGGTVCSLRNSRTTSGGRLVEESNNLPDPSATGGSSESYVCPEGFNGTYRVLLRQVFGKIPAGKVTVEITTRDAAGKPKMIVRQIPVSDRDALLVFDLSGGRRHESLEQQQIATDVQQQLAANQAVSRAVIAQNINSLTNPETSQSQRLATQVQAPYVSHLTPIIGPNGAVGFQPQLTLLPEGVTMTATAVISADRRYVRVTAVPFFSTVGNVTTFNVGQGTTTSTTTTTAAAAPAGGGAAVH